MMSRNFVPKGLYLFLKISVEALKHSQFQIDLKAQFIGLPALYFGGLLIL